MLVDDVKQYKSRYVDRYGAANMMLINAQGETFDLGPADTVVHQTNGRLKMRWKIKKAPAQWYPYTHASFYHNGKVVFMHEVGRLNLYENPQTSVEIKFEYD
jgi:hypothetical protein